MISCCCFFFSLSFSLSRVPADFKEHCNKKLVITRQSPLLSLHFSFPLLFLSSLFPLLLLLLLSSFIFFLHFTFLSLLPLFLPSLHPSCFLSLSLLFSSPLVHYSVSFFRSFLPSFLSSLPTYFFSMLSFVFLSLVILSSSLSPFISFPLCFRDSLSSHYSSILFIFFFFSCSYIPSSNTCFIAFSLFIFFLSPFFLVFYYFLVFSSLVEILSFSLTFIIFSLAFPT